MTVAQSSPTDVHLTFSGGLGTSGYRCGGREGEKNVFFQQSVPLVSSLINRKLAKTNMFRFILGSSLG